MCGVSFLLRSRFEAHKEAEIPSFVAEQAEKRQVSEQNFLRRQREIGRMDAEGNWTKDWRAGIEG